MVPTAAAPRGVPMPQGIGAPSAAAERAAARSQRQDSSGCRIMRPAEGRDWQADEESDIAVVVAGSESLAVRTVPQKFDWARVTVAAAGSVWDCGGRSTGWGLIAPPSALGQWNSLLRAADLDSLATSPSAAEALALVFLDFATAQPLVLADSVQGGQRQPRFSLHPHRSGTPVVSLAVYWDRDSWAANGRIGIQRDYVFELSFDRSGRMRTLALRSRTPGEPLRKSSRTPGWT